MDKINKITKISMNEQGDMAVRRCDIILENGVEIARSLPTTETIQKGDEIPTDVLAFLDNVRSI